MKLVASLASFAALFLIGLTAGLAQAHAEPPPGCLYQAVNWYDPCSGVSPWVQQNGSNWSPVDGIPGMYGPHGYTPRCDSIYCK